MLESELFDIKRVYSVASIKVDQALYHEFLLKSDHTRRNANGQMLRLESLFRILGWQNWDEIDLYQFGKYLQNTKSEFGLFRFGSSRQATIDLLRELEDFLGWLMDFRIPKAMRVRIDGFYGMAKIYRENLQEVEALNRRNTI